ncbi:hypothetical protein E2C01_008966 [Portunus trituberculatus]|uniref:Uncharacterized protein n=1 Tax=Portunus trituberculatus TaxID=210409 RepID=A0A5B7D579_PORTR|nr:hypothetical protein [Portunus trituberculatus]
MDRIIGRQRSREDFDLGIWEPLPRVDALPNLGPWPGFEPVRLRSLWGPQSALGPTCNYLVIIIVKTPATNLLTPHRPSRMSIESSNHTQNSSPPARKPLSRVRNPNLRSDRGQDSNPCACRPLGPQSTQGSTAPRR